MAEFAGCAAQQPIDTFPEALAQAARSIGDGNEAALHSMIVEQNKVGITEKDLGISLEADAVEFGILASKLGHPAAVQFQATVKTKSGSDLDFVLQDGMWKLSNTLIGTKLATDPLLALLMFAKELRALRAHLDGAGVLAAHHSQGLLMTMDKIASDLEAVKAENLVLSDDRCWCTISTGHKFELVREGQTWKVFSVFPAIEFR